MSSHVDEIVEELSQVNKRLSELEANPEVEEALERTRRKDALLKELEEHYGKKDVTYVPYYPYPTFIPVYTWPTYTYVYPNTWNAPPPITIKWDVGANTTTTVNALSTTSSAGSV